jgi:antitoxin YefM
MFCKQSGTKSKEQRWGSLDNAQISCSCATMATETRKRQVVIPTILLAIFHNSHYYNHYKIIDGAGTMQTIETFIPITQAKAKLLDRVRQIHDTNDTIAITKNGVPEAVLLSMKKFEGLLETIDILADPEMMRQLKGSEKDLKESRLIDLDEAF